MTKTNKRILGREEECRRLERCMEADNAQAGALSAERHRQ